MRQLSSACLQILDHLEGLVEDISQEDFCRPSPVLSSSTVGQHVRHTLEFFLCLESGFESGVINYDKRMHDKQIETDKSMAVRQITRIHDFIRSRTHNKNLELEVGYERQNEDFCSVPSNYCRELVYNIEHAVHHMALIKIGVRELAPYVELPEDFGVARSTMRHRETELDSLS